MSNVIMYREKMKTSILLKCLLKFYSERLPSNEQVYYQYSRVGGLKSQGYSMENPWTCRFKFYLLSFFSYNLRNAFLIKQKY